MNVGTLNIKSAEVNGTKPKSLRTWYGGMYIKKKPNRGTCPVKERNMEVFGNDFATVYFREKLCYDVLTEYGTISEGFQKIQRAHAL